MPVADPVKAVRREQMHKNPSAEPPPEMVAEVQRQNCSHMLLGRIRPGSPVMLCGSCPTFWIMARTGVFIAIAAAEADTLAQDLVGAKRLMAIEQQHEPRLHLPNTV